MVEKIKEYSEENLENNIPEENGIEGLFDDEEVVLKKSSFIREYDELSYKEKSGRCKDCGHEIDIDDKICPVCGSVLERASESAYA